MAAFSWNQRLPIKPPTALRLQSTEYESTEFSHRDRHYGHRRHPDPRGDSTRREGVVLRPANKFPTAALGTIAALLAVSTAAANRDWERFPAVAQFDTASDVYAVGDVHGDVDRLAALLAGAGLVSRSQSDPREVRWTGGAATLVVTGDFIDKGPDPLGVIALLRSLQDQAPVAGGRVLVLMGNHEAEFLANPSSEKAAEFSAKLQAGGIMRGDVASCAEGLGAWLCSLPFAVRMNDWFFSHAGNTSGLGLDRLSSKLRDAVALAGFGSPELIGSNSMLEARIGDHGPNGRSWFDSDGSSAAAEELLGRYAAALGVHHIVEGHQHQAVHFPDGARRNAGEMFQWRGKLFLIDVGMSRDIDESSGAILRITQSPDSRAFAVCANGKSTVLWDGRRPPVTGHAKACGSKESRNSRP